MDEEEGRKKNLIRESKIKADNMNEEIKKLDKREQKK